MAAPKTFDIHNLELVLLALLLLVALIAALARRLKISYPIALVITGLTTALLPHSFRLQLSPNIVFLVFMPPLLFSAAWQSSWRELRRNVGAISLLAVGLVAFTVWIAATTTSLFIPQLDWRAGFLLGAILSPTDAVAASSIAHRLGLPRRVVDILEGESLVNDATGLLAFELGLQLIMHTETPSLPGVMLRLLWLVSGGIGVGLFFGYIVSRFEQILNDGPVEIVISIIIPYAAYLAGEAIHSSGVMAVVACGLFLSRRSVTYLSSETRLQMGSVWNTLTFLLNGLVFILIGLQLPFVIEGIGHSRVWPLIGYGLAFSGILIATRIIWLFTATPLAVVIRNRITGREESHPGWQSVSVVGWTGMRGVVSLAAAFSVPYSLRHSERFPARDVIVFITFIVILVTLVLQGSTLPFVIRLLGLSRLGEEDSEEADARKAMLEAAVNHLRFCAFDPDEATQHAVGDLLHQYEHRLEALLSRSQTPDPNAPHYILLKIALETVEVERKQLIQRRDDGQLSDDVLRILERELDLSQSRLAESPIAVTDRL